eukprot:740913_1
MSLLSVTNLIELNQDILCSILTYFGIKEMVTSQLAVVCKAFQSAVNDPSCISEIHCHDWHDDIPQHDFFVHLFKLKHYHPQFRNVEFLQFDMCQIDDFGENITQELHQYAPDIIPHMKKLEGLFFREWNGAITAQDPPFHMKILKQV